MSKISFETCPCSLSLNVYLHCLALLWPVSEKLTSFSVRFYEIFHVHVLDIVFNLSRDTLFYFGCLFNSCSWPVGRGYFFRRSFGWYNTTRFLLIDCNFNLFKHRAWFLTRLGLLVVISFILGVRRSCYRTLIARSRIVPNMWQLTIYRLILWHGLVTL